jgi:hypothetical protein
VEPAVAHGVQPAQSGQYLSVPTWAYTLTGRIVWRLLPVVLRRQLSSQRPKLAAIAVVALVVVAGVLLARSDSKAAESPF